MSRKDYVLLASAISSAFDALGTDGASEYGVSVVACKIARALETDNPRFNRARFLDACGITSEHAENVASGMGRA